MKKPILSEMLALENERATWVDQRAAMLALPIIHRRRQVVGARSGRVVVLKFSKTNGPAGKSRCVCRCDCGTVFTTNLSDILQIKTRSCGCLQLINSALNGRRNIRHGASARSRRTTTYVSWCQMWQRCTNKKMPAYPRYGGRGIRVCSRWKNYANFLKDLGTKPRGHTLGREDNDGNYTPGNCRWETPTEQANNRSTNHWITFRGVTLTVAQWSRKLRIPMDRLKSRVFRGIPTARILCRSSLVAHRRAA